MNISIFTTECMYMYMWKKQLWSLVCVGLVVYTIHLFIWCLIHLNFFYKCTVLWFPCGFPFIFTSIGFSYSAQCFKNFEFSMSVTLCKRLHPLRLVQIWSGKTVAFFMKSSVIPFTFLYLITQSSVKTHIKGLCCAQLSFIYIFLYFYVAAFLHNILTSLYCKNLYVCQNFVYSFVQ